MSVLAIDGPAGAGKSTVAKAVAAALGWRYLDTGAMYRALALAALKAAIPLDDAEALGTLARSLDLRLGSDRVLLDGRDVGADIRTAQVTAVVSRVASVASVRAAMVERQRAVAEREDVVMEGRDIGTAVAPDAEIKVFLTASVEERVRRRLEQLGLADDDATRSELRASIERRDRADAQRVESPFRRPDDAVEVDTTGRSVDEIVGIIAALARSRVTSRGAT